MTDAAERISPADDAPAMAADTGEKLALGARSDLLPDLHAVLVTLHGTPALEWYGSGEDDAWGEPLGPVTFGPDTLHDLRSVSKSVTSLLYGIALGKGLVPLPEAPLLAAFPDYPGLAADPARARLTVTDALNMTLGLEWNEDLPYSDPENSEIAMENAPDRYRFILERPFAEEPGTVWRYNGGATALLGALIERGAGMPLPAFAQAELFGPLGIETFEWRGGVRDNVPSPASGLRLTARGLAAIGGLVLAGGRHEGHSLVPAEWVSRIGQSVIGTSFGTGYSHQFYQLEQFVPALGETRRVIAGMGNGGQRLYVMPEIGLVGVIFCGSYNQPTQWVTPTIVLQRIILANLRAG